MSKKFKLSKDYYGEGFSLYKKGTITIKSGVTVLVGCNGIGKTTLLHQIQDRLRKESIPCIKFDNLQDGGNKSISENAFYNNFDLVGTLMQSSEGESIVVNMGNFARRLGDFVRTGEDPKDKKSRDFAKLFKAIEEGKEEQEVEIPKERWILLDAVDSGLSVDNIVDIKEQLFKTILEYNYGNEIYIVISANEYEMARGEQCLDVYNMKYVKFKDYEEYRNLILQSKEWKYERSKIED